MLRRATICFLVLSAAAPLAAQTDPAAVVQAQEKDSAAPAAEWLASNDARLRAWGAYVTLRDRHRALLPVLVDRVARHVAREWPAEEPWQDRHESMLSVLDAVIQLNGRVAVPNAAGLYQEFPAQALILLARDQKKEAAPSLLDIFRTEDHVAEWLTAGNLLLPWRPPGFTASILRDMTIDVQVRVIDAGSPAAPARGVGISCGGGQPSPRVGWPMVGNYDITSHGTLITAGAVATYYARSEEGPRILGTRHGCAFLTMSRDYMRQELLRTLAGEGGDSPPVRYLVEHDLSWRSDAQYSRDLATFVRGQQNVLSSFNMRLEKKGLMTAGERTAAVPWIDVSITDARSHRLKPLPAVQPSGGNVRMGQVTTAK